MLYVVKNIALEKPASIGWRNVGRNNKNYRHKIEFTCLTSRCVGPGR